MSANGILEIQHTDGEDSFKDHAYLLLRCCKAFLQKAESLFFLTFLRVGYVE